MNPVIKPNVWKLNCLDCRYARTGADMTIHVRATKHSLTRRHQVEVWRVDDRDATLMINKSEPRYEGFLPPF